MATGKKSTRTTTSTTGFSADEVEEFRTAHTTQPFVVSGTDYDADYVPAYGYGLQLVRENEGKAYTDVSTAARTEWTNVRGRSKLSFEQAEPAIRAAFDRTIQLREERLKVSKEEVEGGAVRLKKDVRTEHKEVTVPVEREEVVIERRAVNRPATAADVAGMRDETIRVPVKEERVRVTKEAVVTEEVSVGKKKVTEQRTVGADLKKEELVVEEEGKANVRKSGDGRK